MEKGGTKKRGKPISASQYCNMAAATPKPVKRDQNGNELNAKCKVKTGSRSLSAQKDKTIAKSGHYAKQINLHASYLPDKTDFDSDIVISDEELTEHSGGRKKKSEDRFPRVELIPAYRTSTPVLVKPMRLNKTQIDSDQDTVTEEEGDVGETTNMTSAQLKTWFSTVMSKK